LWKKWSAILPHVAPAVFFNETGLKNVNELEHIRAFFIGQFPWAFHMPFWYDEEVIFGFEWI
jgi:hypothetical protein